TLTLAGGGVILLNVTLPEALTTGLELMVAAAIVALGVFRLRDALREFGGAAPGHLLADHDHGEGAAFHSHPHEHGGHVHAHPHVHPEPSLLSVLGGARPVALRALGIGALHGLAGTAAVSLLVLATLRAPLERSEEHTSELQSRGHLVCRLLLEKKKKKKTRTSTQ